MPNFQAAITTQQPASPQCYISALDTSNYAASTQSGHLTANFAGGFYKVTVIRPNATTYCYSNIAGCDITIPDPATAVFNGIYNFLQTDVDGSYTIRLCVAPAYDTNLATLYDVTTNDVVYYQGQLWAAQSVGFNTVPAVGNPDWLAISESTLEASYPQYCVNSVEAVTCLPPINFQTYGTTGADMDANSDCSALTITDNGNYASNNEAGHALSDFSEYREVTLIRPDTDRYTYSSFHPNEGDALVSPASSGNNVLNYSFLESDEDGIWEVRICSYPTFNDLAAYAPTSAKLIVVYFNGNLYKALQNSTGATPDVSPDDWELYEPTEEDELKTRYCTVYKIMVLCISILKCKERITHEAFCLIDSDFCNEDLLCKNKKFLGALKLKLLIAAANDSVANSRWNEAEKQANLMKQICNCC